MGYSISIDIGGTFTDVVLVDDVTQETTFSKVPTTPHELTLGVVDGIRQAIASAGIKFSDVSRIVHGTTFVTNSILERKGVELYLLATEGFRDVYLLGRSQKPDMYDSYADKPPPLVVRRHTYGIPERMNSKGEVLRALDEEAVKSVANDAKKEGIKSFAVGFLHSYVNPNHERRVREILLQELPNSFVACSSDISPEFREYERTSTAVIAAYVGPLVDLYLSRLEENIQKLNIQAPLRIMQSNGGIISSTSARRNPTLLIESGPAAGVVAAAAIGIAIGSKNVISFDMGGTTAKAGVIRNGVPRTASSYSIGGRMHTSGLASGSGYPILAPVIDLSEVGSGGGSIAWVDQGQALRVGPVSAGAEPGPACYGVGTEPTVTDADLLLGFLNPEYFLGGRIKLKVNLAQAAIRKIAGKLGLSDIDTALGIFKIANSNMAGAIRRVSVRRGIDPREFSLTAFGGAGPVHAPFLAQEFHIPRIIIPPSPGLTSAVGLLLSDVRRDYVKTILSRSELVDALTLEKEFRILESRARKELAQEEGETSNISIEDALDLRYVGQSYELTIPIQWSKSGHVDLEATYAAFHSSHAENYGHSSEKEPIEIVSARAIAMGKVPKIDLEKKKLGRFSNNQVDLERRASKGLRDIFEPSMQEFVSARLYERDRLALNDRLEGPCIVEEQDSTIMIPSKMRGMIDSLGNFILEQ